MMQQMMAIVCIKPGKQGKLYFSADSVPEFVPNDKEITERIKAICMKVGLTVPFEPIITDAKNCCWTYLYGLANFGDLFTPRQMLALISFIANIKESSEVMQKYGYEHQMVKAIMTFLSLTLDKIADANNSLCHYEPVAQCPRNLFCRQAIPMVWDFGEVVPIGNGTRG